MPSLAVLQSDGTTEFKNNNFVSVFKNVCGLFLELTNSLTMVAVEESNTKPSAFVR
jgi:hypothetical protein